MPGGLFITFEGGDGSGKSTQVKSLRERLRHLRIPTKDVREPGGTSFGDSLRLLLKFSNIPLTPEAELWLFNASRAQLVSEVIKPRLEQGHVVISDRFTDSTLAYQGYGRGLSLDKVRTVNNAAINGVEIALTILLDIPPEEGLKRQLTVRERFEWGTPKTLRRSATEISELQAYLPGLVQGPPLLWPSPVGESQIVRSSWPASGQLLGFETGAAEDTSILTGEESGSQAYLPGLELEHAPLEEFVMTGSFVHEQVPEEVMDFHRRVRQGYLELAKREPERWFTIDARLSPQEVSDLIWQRVESMLPASGRVKG